MRAALSPMTRIAAAVALTGTLALGAAACGDDDGGGDANSELVDRLVNELDAPRDEAECIVAELGSDVELLFSLEDPDFEPSDDDLAKLEAFASAGEACGL